MESPSLLVHILMIHLHELSEPFLTVTKESVFWHMLSFLNRMEKYSFLLSSMNILLISSKEMLQFRILWT